MDWQQFIRLISKEKEEDVIFACVHTKNNYYEFTQREVNIIFGKDEDTKTYNYTTYTGGVKWGQK